MSKKRRQFSAEFKAKIVLEVLEGEKTLNEIASKYDLLPKNIQNWKKQFLENASSAFDKSAVVKEYKDEIEQLKKDKDRANKKIVERDWLEGKLKSLDLSIKRKIVDYNSKGKVQADNINKKPSLNRQLELLSISKTAYYYTPVVPFSSNKDIKLLNIIDKIHTKHPYYGTRRVEKLLKRLNLNVGRKLIRSAFVLLRAGLSLRSDKFMGIKALYPKIKTTKANKEHLKHPYLLNDFKNNKGQVVIDTPNKVWSTDITYIKLKNGYAFLATIIVLASLRNSALLHDWNTKKILSWKLSNTMDIKLTTDVLKDALANHPKPEIFNSDQGSQYTAKEHIQRDPSQFRVN